MRYNLLVSLRGEDYGYGWEVASGVTYSLGRNNFPYVLRSGLAGHPYNYDKKIPKEYTWCKQEKYGEQKAAERRVC
jgi:hypothetical protein